MIYDKAQRIMSSLMQNSTTSNYASINPLNPMEISALSKEKEFYENLIDKWLMTTQAIKFNAKKLTENLSLHDSYSVVLSILDSDPTIYKISEEKYISKSNLKNFCTQLVYQIKEDASSIIDLLKTEFELNELIGSQYKKSIVSLVLEELKTNNIYDINVIHNFGFFFPTSRFEPISKDKAQAILNAKKYLYLSKISNSNNNQYISICENFLENAQKGCIDSDVCQTINKIHPNIQIIPNSCSSVNFSPPIMKNNLSQFPFSKSSSDLKDYTIAYKDIEVHIDDFKSLHGNSWLNDRIIHIYGRIIEDSHKDIFFIPPCTVQYIRFKGGKEVSSVVSSWNLKDFSMVFIPFTNSESVRDPGNHWSLLVWFPKNGNRFFHCDSYQSISELSNSSLKSAKSIVKKLIMLCNIKKFKFIKASVPQQDNNYDCGLYLLAYIDFLVEKRSFDGMAEVITHELITSMRSSVERRILNVRK